MSAVTTVGLDLAKNVFQVHGIDENGKIMIRRRLRRNEVVKFFRELPVCRVGMEACGTAHYWRREIAALGHTVKPMPPAYVKPYVKRGKTDATDAEAICEAMTRPTMRFVTVKTADQQATLMLHKTRDLLVRQRTVLINGLRGHLAEFGMIASKGPTGVKAVIEALHAAKDQLPEPARLALHGIADQLRLLGAEIERLETRIVEWHRSNDVSRRLATIPGIGPITPIIPTRRNRKVQVPVDGYVYALRNRIERCFNKLKNARRLTTRYDKTLASYLGFVQIAAIRSWTNAFVNRT